MKQSDSLVKLAPALVAAQGELKAIKPDAKNPEFHSAYVSLDAIISTVRPVLARHDLAIIQGATAPHTDVDNELCNFTVETMLLHSSGEWIMNSAIMPVVGRTKKGGEIGEVNAQQAGGALTFGRRYALAALLCLAADEDDDGNAVSKPRADKPPAERLMPFGKQKGKKLGDIASTDLESTVAWCSKDEAGVTKFKDLIESCSAVIMSRLPPRAGLAGGNSPESPESPEDGPEEPGY